MPDFIREGASVTDSALDHTAGQMRKLADADEQEDETVAESEQDEETSETDRAQDG